VIREECRQYVRDFDHDWSGEVFMAPLRIHLTTLQLGGYMTRLLKRRIESGFWSNIDGGLVEEVDVVAKGTGAFVGLFPLSARGQYLKSVRPER
jgi:hypothetical protein